MQYRILIPCSILPFFFLLVCNVAWFVTLWYLDKKFVVLCHAYLPSKNLLVKRALCCKWLLSICNSSFLILVVIFFDIRNHWSWGVLFKVFLGGLYYTWFLVWIFEIVFFSLKRNNILRSWFIDGSNMLIRLIIPRNQKNVTCFRYIWLWIMMLLDNCRMILDCPRRPYNQDYLFIYVSNLDRDYCYPYKLSCWFSVIALEYPGLEGDIQKSY